MTPGPLPTYVDPMISSATTRLTGLTLLTALGGALSLILTLAPVAQANHAQPPGPINAANTYGWGKYAWQDRFVGPVADHWRIRGKGLVRNRVPATALDAVNRAANRGKPYADLPPPTNPQP